MPIKKLKLDELGRKSIEEFKRSPKCPLVLVLDNIRSAFNVGSIFRTADAFLVEKILLVGNTPTPTDKHQTIEKTALSASCVVDWQHCTTETIASHLSELKSKGYLVLALEQTDNAIPLHRFSAPEGSKFVLVCGNEVEGVSSYILDQVDGIVEIPQHGTKHSLNVGVATGIALFHLQQMVRPA